MKLNAVGVFSRDLKKSVEFYSLLGFVFPPYQESDDHVEAITEVGATRLMIDSYTLVKELLKEEPKAATTSAFALEYDSPSEVDAVANKVKAAGFSIVSEPWDAFWGQRYSVVRDPEGFKVDLYAKL